jgi:predicted HTH domain antitoxin
MRFFPQQRFFLIPKYFSSVTEPRKPMGEEVEAEADQEEVGEAQDEAVSEGDEYVVDSPVKTPVVGTTRTAVAAFALYEHAAAEGLDLRLLSELFRRFDMQLKVDAGLQEFCTTEYDVNPPSDRNEFDRDPVLTEEQKEACLEDKERRLDEEIMPELFEDIIALGRTQELDLFHETIMFMIEEGKTKYMRQFSEEFARLTCEAFNEIPVTVTSAFELSEKQKEMVQDELEEKAVGDATPVVTFRVNPLILGGVLINWGNKYDYESAVAPWFETGLENLKGGLGKEEPGDDEVPSKSASASA